MRRTGMIHKALSALFSCTLVLGLWPVTAAAADSFPSNQEEASSVNLQAAKMSVAENDPLISQYASMSALGTSFSIQAASVTNGGSASVSRANPTWNSSAGGKQYQIAVNDKGLYRLRTVGAKGQKKSYNPGEGGTTTAVTPLDSQTLYVVTGGAGSEQTGGANGGGNGGKGSNSKASNGGAGGGATHIARAAGELSSFGTEAGVAASVLLVAGGGGGSTWPATGGSGGGATGEDAGMYQGGYKRPLGGAQYARTQDHCTAGTIGKGANGANGAADQSRGHACEGKGGGGGGYYGGMARSYQNRNNSDAGGAGGSGYLNASFITGTKASDGGSIALEGITVAQTARKGGTGAGTAAIQYLASIITLDAQNATEAGTPTLYADPDSDAYHVTYSVNGLGDAVGSIEAPTREGWVFKGYYTEQDGQGTQFVEEDGTIIDGLYEQGTTTLYAWWWPIVSYHTNGVAATDMPANEVVQPTHQATQPANPQAETNDFKGWSTNQELYQPYDFSTSVTQPTQLYAFWSPHVEFNLKGHGEAIDPQFLQRGASGQKATRPDNPTATGYTFECWCTDAELEHEFDFDTPINTDTVLYAKWAANRYTVEFYEEGELKGTQDFMYDEETTPLKTAEELELSREGWDFAGWRDGDPLQVDYTDGQEVQNLSTETGQFPLRAVWTRNITFTAGTGPTLSQTSTGLTAASTDTVEIGQLSGDDEYAAITAPKLETLESWNPVGWLSSTVAASSADITAGTTFTPQTTEFYGLYNRDFTLFFNGNGATYGRVHPLRDVQRLNASGEVTPLTFVLPANEFVFPGWRFAEWDLGAPGQAITLKPAANTAAETTAYALWDGPYEFTVVFNANGGEGAMDAQAIPEHAATALSPNAFTREGSEFTGWNTKADGSGTPFADKAEVTDLAKAGGSVTLYAQWKDLSVVRPAQLATTSDSLLLLAAGIAALGACAALAFMLAKRNRMRG